MKRMLLIIFIVSCFNIPLFAWLVGVSGVDATDSPYSLKVEVSDWGQSTTKSFEVDKGKGTIFTGQERWCVPWTYHDAPRDSKNGQIKLTLWSDPIKVFYIGQGWFGGGDDVIVTDSNNNILNKKPIWQNDNIVIALRDEGVATPEVKPVIEEDPPYLRYEISKTLYNGSVVLRNARDYIFPKAIKGLDFAIDKIGDEVPNIDKSIDAINTGVEQISNISASLKRPDSEFILEILKGIDPGGIPVLTVLDELQTGLTEKKQALEEMKREVVGLKTNEKYTSLKPAMQNATEKLRDFPERLKGVAKQLDYFLRPTQWQGGI